MDYASQIALCIIERIAAIARRAPFHRAGRRLHKSLVNSEQQLAL
jgi:hypothetical protein